MPFSLLRGTLAALLVLTASCEINVDPGDGGSDGFSLLIERRNAAGQRTFYTMSGDGVRFTPFTNVPADARTLIPSPDGRTIAYLRDVNGFVELWAMDRDGANRRGLLTGPWHVQSASWSPDGNRIVMSVTTDTRTDDIAKVDANGSNFVWLTSDPLPGVIFDRDPSFSHDGTRIAFSSNASGTTRLWIMNADGSASHQVLSSAVASSERQPVWSPDTTDFIAVVATTPAGPGITFVRDDGTDYKHIPISPGPNDPVWLPDGRLVYVANETGDYDLWTVDRVSGETRQLTSRRDDDVHAAVLMDVARYAWLGFAPAVSYQVNRPFAVDIAAADVLTDGNEDLLILSPLFNEIRLMKGTRTGVVQSVGAMFAEADVSALRVGRVTGDLAPDVVGRADSAAYVWRGRVDGPGIATRIALNGEVRDSAVVDMDGDGRAESVSLVENASQPFRLKTHTINATDDGFVLAANMATTRTAGRSLCAGDMNGDGWPDLAIFAGTTNLSAFVAEGRGEVNLNQPLAAGTSLSSDLAAIPYCADFNNDGRDDVALFSVGVSQGVAVHRYGTGAFGAATRIGATANGIAIADIDRDGDLDIVLASSSTSEILVAKNRGRGTFDAPTSFPITNVPRLVSATDLNGDTWPDLVVLDATGGVAVLVSRGRTGM